MKISHIFDSVELTEEQKQRIDEAFANAVQTEIDEQTKVLTEEVEEQKQFLQEKVEEYAEYVTDELQQKSIEYMTECVQPYYEDVAKTAIQEFVTENKEKFEALSGTYLAESLMQDMKQVFEKHNVQVPKGADQVQLLQESNSRINSLMSNLREKDEKINTLIKESIIAKETQHLTESQKDKIHDELMGLTFISEETFKTACSNAIKTLEIPRGKETISENKQTNTINFSNIDLGI